VGLCAVWAVTIVVVFAWRVGFPLELEWMEGGSLQQALRIQRGDPIYGPPSAQYVPFLYPPLYPALLAALGTVFPLGLVLGRVVSILSVVAIGAALWRLVGSEGKPWSHQAVAVGLFASGYVFTYRWIDVARGDALFMALTIWALVVLREAWGDWRKALLAGALMGLAFWTKQTAFVFVVASGIAGLLVAPRQLWIYALTVGVIGLGGVAIGQQLTDGWLWIYIYELHQTHPFNWLRFSQKTWAMFVHAAPFLVVLVGVVVFDVFAPILANRRRLDDAPAKALETRLKTRRGLGYWSILAAAGLLVSALGYSTLWAEPNAFIPGVTLGAAALAVGLPKGGRLEVAALGLVCAQLVFAWLVEPVYQPLWDEGMGAIGRSYRWQSPARTFPTSDQRARARAQRDMLESANGPVFALHRPWWSVIAAHQGRPGHVGAMGLNDVPPEAKREILRGITTGVTEGQFTQIWIEGEPPPWLRRSLARTYKVAERRWGDARVRPLTGYMSDAGMTTEYRRAQLRFEPIAPRQVPNGVEVIADFETGSLRGCETEGLAFGRRAVGSFYGRQPPIGPIGGAFVASSAANPEGQGARGRLRSPSFVLPPGGEVRLMLGRAGPSQGLSVVIRDDQGDIAPVEIPDTRWSLESVAWPIPEAWAGRTVRLELVDDSPKSALFVDDVWIVGAP